MTGDHQNRVTDYTAVVFSRQRSDVFSVVRRLTPVECERLQGFPDNWTAYGHDDKPISDTKRYAAIGNSVAIPCVDYIMSGIIDVTPKTGK